MRASASARGVEGHGWLRGSVAALAGLAGFLLPCRPARALINPDFTPADLVRSSDRILVLEVAAPEEGRMTARVVRTLKGEAPDDPTFRLDATRGQMLRPDEVVVAFAGRDRVPAVYFVNAEPGWEEPDGAVQIDTTWFAVRVGEDGTWMLDGDLLDVEAVWAGSAIQLERAVRMTLEDPSVDFPVAANMRWERIESLGRLEGQAMGMLRADLGDPIGPVALVLSVGGDRLVQIAGGGQTPVDITGRAGLRTASRQAAVGDFTGNGRMDIASWDGRDVLLAVQGDDATFATRRVGVELADCRSMAAVDVGGDRSGLLLGQGDGAPVLVVPSGAGGFAIRRWPAPAADLGPGGVCLAADLDGNGRWDVVQAFARGLVLYRGRAEPGTFDDPVAVPMPLVENPGSILAADFDLDGRLDLVVAGDGGIVLLRQEDDLRWVDATQITGELWRHANVGGERIVAVVPADINADGRPGMALMLPGANPLVFFNRGFGVFGLAMDLLLAESDLDGAANLARGQTAGLMADLTGNGAQDLLTADPDQGLWLARGRMSEEAPAGLWLTLSLPAGARGPRTVTVSARDRVEGIHVLRPGVPAVIGCRRRGPVDLTWTEPDHSRRTRRIVVIRPADAVLEP